MKILPKIVSTVLICATAIPGVAIAGYAEDEANYFPSSDSAILSVDGNDVSFIENEYYKVYADFFGKRIMSLSEKLGESVKIDPAFKEKVKKSNRYYVSVVFNSFDSAAKEKYKNEIIAPCNSVPVAMIKIKSEQLDSILADDNVKAVLMSFPASIDMEKTAATADCFQFNYEPTASDARKILRYVAKLDSAPSDMTEGKRFFILSDTDLDNVITAKDARASLRISAKLETGKEYIKTHSAMSFWNDSNELI